MPVTIKDSVPIAVTMAEGPLVPRQPLDPTTTAEEDRHTSGQRRINIIWESTQAFVAVTVTISTLYVSSNLALKEAGEAASYLLLSNAFFLVIGFYFGRTNHQKVGGVQTGR